MCGAVRQVSGLGAGGRRSPGKTCGVPAERRPCRSGRRRQRQQLQGSSILVMVRCGAVRPSSEVR